MTLEEGLFFDRAPQMLSIYAALRDALVGKYANVQIAVSKTQISFRNRHIFAMVSLRGARMVVSFGLAHRLESPRIWQAAEPYPNRWTHHVPLSHPNDVDAELLAWLDAAHRFAIVK